MVTLEGALRRKEKKERSSVALPLMLALTAVAIVILALFAVALWLPQLLSKRLRRATRPLRDRLRPTRHRGLR